MEIFAVAVHLRVHDRAESPGVLAATRSVGISHVNQCLPLPVLSRYPSLPSCYLFPHSHVSATFQALRLILQTLASYPAHTDAYAATQHRSACLADTIAWFAADA